jgi:tetratricopeptide (TPR) repeat protein
MSTKLKNIALSAAAFLILAGTASAQVSAVEGIVKDDTGKPIVGAVVHIERKDIKGNYTTKTDKKGHYGHYGLPLGNYKLTLEVDGKPVDTVDNVRTKLGDPLVIPFNLQPKRPETAAGGPGGQAPVEVPKEQLQKMSKEERDKFEKANKDREAGIAKNKALNDTYTAGKDALAAKNYDLAIENLKKASEIDATQNVIWTQLAEAYIGQAATKPAAEQDAIRQMGLDAYKKAIELKPEDAALYNNYGLALVKAKKIPEAQEALNKAAEVDPANAVRYFYNLGAVLVNSNQSEPAAEAFQKAIKSYDAVKAAGAPPADITKNYAEANYQLGITLLGKAKTDAATGKVTPVPGTAEAFNKYLELQPDGPFADSAKGLVASIGSTVGTTYKNPDAEKKPTKKK